MGLRIEKVKGEFKAFRQAMKESKAKGRKWSHRFVDFFVEKNRHMPYFWGHVEPFLYVFLVILFIEVSQK